MRVLIAGCGYVGGALASRLASEGHEVFGLRRTPRAREDGIHPVAADVTDPRSLGALPEVDVLVFAAAPGVSGESAYRATYVDGLRNVLRASGPPPRVLFTSSTAVYGQTDGSYVDESSEAEPLGYRGRVMLEAERLVGALGTRGTILRLAGLYGPGRARLLDAVVRGEAEYTQGEISNRIHRDDAAGALRHLLALPGGLYVGVDDEPAEKEALLRWLAERTGSPKPRQREAGGSDRSGNKRLSNRRLRGSGYVFIYPSYREGFESLLAGR